MSRIVQMEVLDVRPHRWRANYIEVEVEIPLKDGMTQREWMVPNMHEVKRRYGVKDLHDEEYLRMMLVGKRLRIPELEVQAEKAGYKMVKRRRDRG